MPPSGYPIMKSGQFSKHLSFRICVYRSKDDNDLFVAHCLELDLTGIGECVETALTELLENIDTQRDVCQHTGAQFWVAAPDHVWKDYARAKKAGRKIAQELIQRVYDQANKRLGHEPPLIVDDVGASGQVPDQFLSIT